MAALDLQGRASIIPMSAAGGNANAKRMKEGVRGHLFELFGDT
jgi:hypothetical protein